MTSQLAEWNTSTYSGSEGLYCNEYLESQNHSATFTPGAGQRRRRPRRS